MLLDEDPATLISSCTSNFHLSSDRDSLSRITSSLSTLRESRSLRLTSQQTALKQLTKTLHNIEQQRRVEVESTDVAKHAEEVLRLDGEKFRMAKEASEAENEVARLEGEVRRWEGMAAQLENRGEREGDEMGPEREKEILKLQIYRSLGIEPQVGKDGEWTKLAVRREQDGKKLVRVVEMEKGRRLGDYTEQVWACV